MKTGFILVAHAPLATAFLSVIKDTFGSAELIEAVDIVSDEPAERHQAQLSQAWMRLGACPKVLVTDLLGATPARAAEHFAQSKNCLLFSPLSMPLIFKLLCYRNLTVQELREKGDEIRFDCRGLTL